jgi:hypothetical protein
MHPAVPPGRVLPRQPRQQVTDLRAGTRAAWPVRVRSSARDQPAVPGQQCARRDQPMDTQHRWKQPGQRRQDRPVSPVRPGPRDLTAEHRDLMTEHHDLRILGRPAAAQQHQPAKDPDHDQVEQAKGHKPRSCRDGFIWPNHRSQHPAASSEAVQAGNRELLALIGRPGVDAAATSAGLDACVNPLWSA